MRGREREGGRGEWCRDELGKMEDDDAAASFGERVAKVSELFC